MIVAHWTRCSTSWILGWCVALSAGQVWADDLVIAWNQAMLQAVRVERTAPPVAARAFAMVHIAMFDAVNSFDRRYHSYTFNLPAPRQASPQAAAAVAAHRVLREIFPNQRSSFDALLEESLEGIPWRAALLGGGVGRLAAEKIIRERRNDGSTRTVEYTSGSEPGDWQPTPPAFAPALLPQWPYVKPFAMRRGRSFRPIPPPAIDSLEYAIAYEEVRLLGDVDSAVRTEDQTEIAWFWADGAGTATPPGHWNRIAQDLALERDLNLLDSARLFALLNIAEADAAICAWDAKYYFDYWRPVTAIWYADTDDNPHTSPDLTWSSLVPTPPFPTYTSGHSTFSGAAAAVLANLFEDDHVAFSSSMEGNPGVVREYSSFSEAAEEAGQSRIYGGIHWQFDNLHGLITGDAIGEHCCQTQLRPKRRR